MCCINYALISAQESAFFQQWLWRKGGVRSRTAPSPASAAPATPHRARGPENTAPSVLEGPGAQVAQRVATVSHNGRASCKYYRIAVCDLDLAGTTH